jgi:hypothetical protein
MEPVSGKINTSRGPADKAIEPILELSADAQLRRKNCPVCLQPMAKKHPTETVPCPAGSTSGRIR